MILRMLLHRLFFLIYKFTRLMSSFLFHFIVCYFTQLLNILKSEIKEPHDIVFIQVAALTINSIFSDNPEFARVHIFEEIYKPFKFLEFSTEDEICNVVHQMFNLFVVPTNDVFSVPVREIIPTCRILFHMHCRIKVRFC